MALAIASALPLAASPADAATASKKARPAAAAKSVKSSKASRPTLKGVRKAERPKAKRVVRRPPSLGQLSGLHSTPDPLDLKSSVALVMDPQTDEVLFSKNPDAVLPIASITKLMTALVVVDAGLALEESLEVSQDDVRGTVGSRMRSKLRPGTRLSRGELMHLSLMASENRAAHALGRTYPGGLGAFVRAMNRKAAELGMSDTRYVEPTGLSADNRSSASDLALLVKAASGHPVIRDLSTSLEAVLPVGPKPKPVQFRNTNGLVRNPDWDIGLQKTGFISAAGRCVVMQAELAGRQLIMVLLDSAGRYSRIGDAERLRRWLSEQSLLPLFGRGTAPMPLAAGSRPPISAVPEPATVPTVPAVPSVAPGSPVSGVPQSTPSPVAVFDLNKPWVHVPVQSLVVERPAEGSAQAR